MRAFPVQLRYCFTLKDKKISVRLIKALRDSNRLLCIVLMLLGILVATAARPAAAGEATAAQLWADYQAAPNVHPNLPNCSFAGYGRGEVPLPVVPIIANVKDCGATGDGTSDDLPAFRAAIAKAAGKGAVLIPAGTYRLGGHLVLPDNTVLRGEGPAILCGASLVTLLIAPTITLAIKALHRTSRRGGGRIGEILFLVILAAGVAWTYYQLTNHGPAALLPAEWRNGR